MYDGPPQLHSRLTNAQDEGHRLKNADAKLFRELQQFKSASRFLITGTPLQNNLKELWSLLHFLMPSTFLDWEAFEIWFDFTDLADEQGTQQFIGDQANQDLVKKIHKVLQPLLLRRIKADVADYLPKKREYVLYAPMTKEQTDLYNVISDRGTDTRSYLENKVVERLTGITNTPQGSTRASRQFSRAGSAAVSEADSPSPSDVSSTTTRKSRGRPRKSTSNGTANGTGNKRKAASTVESPESKSTKSSRQSTPATTRRGNGRPTRSIATYNVADDSDDDKLDDDAFEAKLVAEMEAAHKYEDSDEFPQEDEDSVRSATLELASKCFAGRYPGQVR
jgi:ATP-dependent DNA helicase